MTKLKSSQDKVTSSLKPRTITKYLEKYFPTLRELLVFAQRHAAQSCLVLFCSNIAVNIRPFI